MGRQDLAVELFYGGAWTPAPAYVRNPVSITRGRGNETGGPSPQELAGTLDNRSGDYNPRNASSPLYGLVGRNTPVRSGLTLASETFGGSSSSGWTPADTGQAWTGVGAAAVDFTESGGLGRHLQPVKNIVRLSLLPEDRRDVEQVTTAAVPAVVTGASAVVGHVARYQPSGDYYWLRMEFDVGGALTAKISKWTGGGASLTEVAALSGIPGLTYTGGQGWNVRTSVAGRRLAIRVWRAGTSEPSTWTLTAVDSSITGAGRYGLSSWVVAGNTNTTEVQFDNYTAVDRRAAGEIASWKPDRSLGFKVGGRGDAWTEIAGGGVLRRLSQGNDPLGSPLRRMIPGLQPTAYWPLEDADGAQSAQSAVAGIPDMRPFSFSRFTDASGQPVPSAGLPKFGTGSGIPGSASVPDLSQGGGLSVNLAPPAGTVKWRVQFVVVFPRDKVAAVIPLRWQTNSSSPWTRWEFQVDSGGISVTASRPSDGVAGWGISTSAIRLWDGQPHVIELLAQDSGGNASCTMYIDDWNYGTLGTINAVSLAGSVGAITQVDINPLDIQASDATLGSMPQLGHLAVWQPWSTTISGVPQVVQGYAGEPAGTRFLRLCAEEGIAATFLGADPADTALMGPQRTGIGMADHLAEIERTEGGMVYEPRDSVGLVLRGVRDMYNQAAALTIDYAAGQVAPPFAPTTDDLGVRNDVTAKSTTSGAEVRATLDVGAMSTQPPTAGGVGRYPFQLDVNPFVDTQLGDAAGWALAKGTVDEMRVARVTVDLMAFPGLASAVSAVDMGDRIVIAGLPSDMGSNQASLIVLGSTEVVESHRRTITFNCVPATPYDAVALAGGSPRVAADGSALAAALPTEAAVVDAFGRTVAGGWGTADSGQAWATSGGSASDYSVNGSAGLHSLGSVNVSRRTITGSMTDSDVVVSIVVPALAVGAPINAGVIARHADASNYYLGEIQLNTDQTVQVRLRENVAGTLTTLVTSANVAGLTHTVGRVFRLRLQVQGSTLRARVWDNALSEPPDWHAVTTDTTFTTAGQVGLRSVLGVGSTNTLPVVVSYDDLIAAEGRSFLLASTADNGTWTQDPTDMPLDIRVGGERVTASAIASSVADAFGRTVASGWANADTGQPWTPSGAAAADYSVASGLGQVSQGSVNVLRHVTMPMSWTDVDVTVDVSWLIGQAVGAPVTAWLIVGSDLSNYYAARIDLGTSPTVGLALLKRVGGTLTSLPGASATAGANAGGDSWRLRLTKSGTRLNGQVTNVTSGAASASVTATDSDLSSGTLVGVISRLEGGNTNTLPVVCRFDNFVVANPQLVTLSARGVNGVSRAWPAGTAVDVWAPAIVPL